MNNTLTEAVTHTMTDKLLEYFISPFTNIFVIIAFLGIIFNIFTLLNLRKIKAKDNFMLLNMFVIGIYVIMAFISAYQVSSLSPHAGFNIDNCDFKYMQIPRQLFKYTAILNILYMIFAIVVNKLDSNKYEKTKKEQLRNTDDDETKSEEKDTNLFHFDKNNLENKLESIKDSINIDSVKDKIDGFVQNIKSKIKKE